MVNLFKKKEILTVPNLLSFLRLIMIPVIVWLYLAKNNYYAATAVIILSGITDIADGFIARKFNMISNFGKILDPIADKLTQGMLIISLCFRHNSMITLIILFVIKEFIMAVLGAITLKKHDSVNSSKWHGKINTVVLYLTMLMLILFPDFPKIAERVMVTLCIITMTLSTILYFKFYLSLWKNEVVCEKLVQ